MKIFRVPYVSTVRNLMYVVIYIRPNIAQAMGMVSRFMTNSTREHWKAIRRVLIHQGNLKCYYVSKNQN